MIVQTASTGSPHFVIEQSDHARTSGQLASAFGNDRFAAPDPFEQVLFVTAHHDEGWVLVDSMPERAPSTGLPHHLTQTPLSHLLATSKGSPDFNQANHPLCGLLSSMHTYGLFNGRYGLSDFIFIDNIPAENRPAMQAMLDEELERQRILKLQVPEKWGSDEQIFTNYKLLQFFDTLALYFQMTHAEKRGQIKFKNVPDGKGTDHDLVIVPGPDESYALDPWPFEAAELVLTTQGRYLTPQPEGTDMVALMSATPKEIQAYRLARPA